MHILYRIPHIFRRLRFVASSLGVLIPAVFSTTLSAAPFDCSRGRCGLHSLASYPQLVIGTVKAVATDQQAGAVYRWARQNGYWATLSGDEARFVKFVQPMAIEVPGDDAPETFTLLMGRDEYDASPIQPGDFVRYTPHQLSEPASPLYDDVEIRKYWDLFGCIAVLCRADDLTCPSRYVEGVFRVDNGIQLNVDAGERTGYAVQIDTETYWPRRTGSQAAGDTIITR